MTLFETFVFAVGLLCIFLIVLVAGIWLWDRWLVRKELKVLNGTKEKGLARDKEERWEDVKAEIEAERDRLDKRTKDLRRQVLDLTRQKQDTAPPPTAPIQDTQSKDPS